MEERRKHIDDLFREELGSYRENPEPNVWHSLEQRLPAEDKRSYRWLWLLLLLALMASLGYYVNRIMNESKSGAGGINENKNGIENTISSNSNSTNDQVKETDDENLLNSKNKNTSGKKYDNYSSENLNERKHHNEEDNDKISNATSKGKILNKKKNEQENITGSKKSSSNTSINKANNISDDDVTANEKKQNDRNQAENRDLQNVASERSKAKAVQEKTDSKLSKGNKDFSANTKIKNASNNPDLKIKNNKDQLSKEKIVANDKNKMQNAKAATTTKDTASNKTKKTAEVVKNNKTNPLKVMSDKDISAKEKNDLEKAKQEPEIATTTKKEKTQFTTKASDKNETAKNNSSVTATKNDNDSNAKKNIALKNEPDNKKGITVTPEKSAPKPISTEAETFKKKTEEIKPAKFNDKQLKNKEGAIFDERNNINNNASEKPKTSNISVAHEEENGKPIIIPEEEYGIKIEDFLSEQEKIELAKNDEGNNDQANPEETGGSGGGGGGGGSNAATKKNKNGLKIEGGVKLAFDKGFSQFTTNNYVVSPFFQWNISSKVSLLLQPGFRYNQLNKTNIFDGESFHEVTGQSRDSLIIPITFDTTQRNYFYYNTYDSIVTGYNIKPKNYFEIELPILLQFRIAENILVFGGIQMTFGNLLQIEGSVQRISGLQKADTITLLVDSFDIPNTPSINNYFNYNTPEFSTFNPDDQKNPLSNPARFGLMFGFSYEIRKRFLIDVLVRKNISDMNYIPNEQVRKIYTQPYMRISIGYKLFK